MNIHLSTRRHMLAWRGPHVVTSLFKREREREREREQSFFQRKVNFVSFKRASIHLIFRSGIGIAVERYFSRNICFLAHLSRIFIQTSRKHAYIILTPLNRTFI